MIDQVHQCTAAGTTDYKSLLMRRLFFQVLSVFLSCRQVLGRGGMVFLVGRPVSVQFMGFARVVLKYVMKRLSFSIRSAFEVKFPWRMTRRLMMPKMISI